ncbi:MAG: cytochrome b/b6 domain-containing protein [Acidihalobacter sp.]|uniref:cytochrome b n=1 Tax=Acidihalobacter sp. TaxID=1872108 RepID=UPI00307EF7B4
MNVCIAGRSWLYEHFDRIAQHVGSLGASRPVLPLVGGFVDRSAGACRPVYDRVAAVAFEAQDIPVALYLLLVVMPLSGWVYNSASGFPLPWFGLVQLPAIAPTSKSLAAAALLVHKTAFWSLLVLLALHIGAAFYHHWRVGDDVLRRMLPFVKRGRS